MIFKPPRFIILVLISLIATTSNAASHKPKIIWTAVFSNITPINNNISQSYCNTHTPTVIITTIKQITSSNGVRALNGINVRYLSYKTVRKNHLYFNIVDAIVSGKNSAGKTWSEKMKLYEQTLSPVGLTYTVWSTTNCKGTFLGTPTELNVE